MNLKRFVDYPETFYIYSLYLVIVVIIFFVNSSIQAPMIQGDEGSYLANAAAIAGFPNDMSSSYHPGYSLLIAGAFIFADSSMSVWNFVMFINALLLGLSFVLINKIVAIFVPQRTFAERLIISLLVTLYPMWITISGYSFSENAFVPVYLMTVLLYLKALTSGKHYWVLLGIGLGFLYWIHPKALVVITAFTLSQFFLIYKEKKLTGLVITLSSIIFMVFLLKFAFFPWLHEQMTISGHQPDKHYPEIKQLLLSPFTSWARLKIMIAVLAGHVFYLSIGTLGLIWLSIGGIYQQLKGRNYILEGYSRNIYLTFIIYIFLSFAGTLILSSISFPTPNRLDHWMYGRYVEGVIAPILLLGLLANSYKSVWLSIVIAGVSALILTFWMGSYGNTAPFNVSTFWQEFYIRSNGVWYWFIFGAIGILLLTFLPKNMGQLFIAGFFIFCLYHQIKYHKAASANALRRSTIAQLVKDNYIPGTCVGFDHSGVDSYHKKVFWYDLSFALYNYRLQRMSFEKWLDSCDGPLFSYSKSLDKNADIKPLGTANFNGPILWSKNSQNIITNQKQCPIGKCIEYNGKHVIPSNVGVFSDKGMKTDGRAGYLMFGPYQPMSAGEYILQITGKLNSGGKNVVVDVVHNKGRKIDARFRGLKSNHGLSDHLLLEEKLTLQKDVEELEVRVLVDKKTELLIDGYSLKHIKTLKLPAMKSKMKEGSSM